MAASLSRISVKINKQGERKNPYLPAFIFRYMPPRPPHQGFNNPRFFLRAVFNKVDNLSSSSKYPQQTEKQIYQIKIQL